MVHPSWFAPTFRHAAFPAIKFRAKSGQRRPGSVEIEAFRQNGVISGSAGGAAPYSSDMILHH